MKALRLSLLLALLSSSAALAAPVPVEMAGSYQALLFTESGDTGSPVGLVALTVSTKGAVSGKLTTDENKTYAFKTTLDYTAAVDPEENEPIGTAIHAVDIPIKRGKLTELRLELVFQNFSATEQTFEATLTGEIAGETDEGFKVKTYAPKTSAPTLGAYTMALELAAEPDEGEPAGSGYAVGKIDAKGILKLTGKTGDGTAFTASLPNGSANQFVMFVNPYKRPNSFLAGKIALTERSDDLFHMLPNDEEDEYDFQWKKAGLEKDKSYPDGFEPLNINTSIEPWIAPEKGQTIANLLGLDLETEVFEIDLGITVPNDRKPIMLVINSKNALEVKYNGSGLVTDQKAFAKIFSGKVDPKTGKITATLNLEDSVQTGPLKFKTVKRKVLIEGVLFNFADGFEAFASALVLLPPKDPKTATTTSSSAVFEDIQTDPMVVTGQSGLAGNYAGTFTRLVLTTTPPDDIPQNGTVHFSISSDLKTLTFNGRALPLSAYSAAGPIAYTDKSNVKNIVTASLLFDPATLAIVNLDVTYNQLVGREVRFGTSRSGSPNNIAK